MKKEFVRADDGNIQAKGAKGWASNYQKAVEDYVTLWNELFEKAQEADEFQFIFALLRVRGIVYPGWDTFENTIDAFEGTMKAARKVDGTRRLNILLWLYGHIVEASDHYEIIANMVNIAGGGSYRAWNFPKIKTHRGMREQTPNEKILEIKKRCDSLGLKDYSQPFAEVFDKDLRNAVYHSDYSVHTAMVRFRSADGYDVEYDAEKTNLKVNQAMALHETIKNLFGGYTASYTEPKIIDASPGFSPGQPMKAQVIVRKKHGVMAIQETPSNPGSFACGIYKPGEKEKILKGIYLLPPSRTDELNRFLDRLPLSVASKVLRLYNFFYDADKHS
jgi:hypothetical protein